VRSGLEGVNVGLLETRMSGALAELVRRRGGVPHCAAALREAPLDCAGPIASFLDDLDRRTERVVVFLTGAGASALFQEAEKHGRLVPLIEGLNRAAVVCRGPKPTAVLARHNLTSAVAVVEPYTTRELLDSLEQLDLLGTDLTLVHYGERNGVLADALIARGARLHELCLYEWLLPENLQPLQQMVSDLLTDRIDALIFTSQIQCRHLFQVASDMSLGVPLRDALNSRVVVAVMGPVCRETVEGFGVRPQVEPEHPKMAAVVQALARHFAAPPVSETRG
jgi:uroporphyrinogen-III synthase